MIDGRHLIGGDWIDGTGAAPNVNPSDTTDIVGHFPRGGHDMVARAVDAALHAKTTWMHSNIQKRHDLLRAIGDTIMARKDELGMLLAREEGKPLAEAIGEAARAAQVFWFFAGECLRFGGEKLPSIRDGVDVEITREPLGVIGIIAPWNFPIAIPAWKIAPALAFGNCVIFKPADLVPASAYELGRIIDQAGLPPGVFNMVFGKGREVGEAMTSHPGIDAITFTGSVPTGRAVALACVGASPMKKIQLEMGGKNPMIILDDADIDVAFDAATSGAYLSTGQRCTSPERFIVTEGIHDRFVSGVVERLRAMKVGHALDADTQIGPVVSEAQLESNLDFVARGQSAGATLAFGGERVSARTPGHYMTPVLFTDVTNDMTIAREETFGPFSGVIRVRNYDEALAVANDTEFGLSSGICTTSLKYASHYKRHSTAGLVMVNLPTAGLDYHVPFGGRRNSSYGPREQGRYAVEFYTAVKTAYTAAG